MALACCRAALRRYQSSSNRCLKRINRSCFTQGRRSDRLHPASVTGWWGADVTGNSSWGAGAMLIVSADSDALYNCVKQFENQHTSAFLMELIVKSQMNPSRLVYALLWCLIIWKFDHFLDLLESDTLIISSFGVWSISFFFQQTTV